MNSTEIFALALGLNKPWILSDVKMISSIKGAKELHIYIGHITGTKFEDEENNLCSIYDTKERSWRHLNFFEHECYLHCSVPRIQTSSGLVKQVNVPWARAESGFTLLFEAFAMQLIECEMPVSKAGDLLGEYPNRIWRIFNYWIKRAYDKVDHSGVTELGIDETSTKKGHNYVTIAVDMDTHAVLHATKGKDAETITKIKEYLITKAVKPSQIKEVSIDLSAAFVKGVEASFAEAKITFDRFHVKKLLNQAMDEVRKAERKEHAILKGHRYLFLKENANLSARQKADREKYIELLPVLGKAYRLKELFDDFWTMRDIEEASGFMMYWTDLAKESMIPPMIKFAKTIRAHWTGIIHYIKSKLTNGILEGINSKIQLAKKRARGYRNIDNFINMIYFIAGKLEFHYPH